MPYFEENHSIATKLIGVCGVSTVYDKERGVKSPSFLFVKNEDQNEPGTTLTYAKKYPDMIISPNDIKLRMQLRQNILSYLYYHPEKLRVLYREELNIIAEIELQHEDIIIVQVGNIHVKYSKLLADAYATRIKSWMITGMPRKLEGKTPGAKLGMNVCIDLLADVDLKGISYLLND